MKLKALREMRGMQQKELAINLHVSQPTVCDWQTGRKLPSSKNMMKIAQFFGVTVNELLSDDAAETVAQTKIEPLAVSQQPEQLNGVLVEMLKKLSPSQIRRVQDFVAGMQASDTE